MIAIPALPWSSTSLRRFALGAWAAALLVLLGPLAGAHLLTLPAPAPGDPRLARLAASTDPRWTVAHVLRASCRCSQAIAEHLAARGADVTLRERVFLIDGDPVLSTKLEGAGYEVLAVTEASLLEDFGTEAVPLLVVLAPGAIVRYLGGYTTRKQGPVIQDVHIVSDLRAGRSPVALPLFGCAVSPRLRRATDPFGVR